MEELLVKVDEKVKYVVDSKKVREREREREKGFDIYLSLRWSQQKETVFISFSALISVK